MNHLISYCMKKGSIACYVSVMESDSMVTDATDAAIKKAKKLGIPGPFKTPIELKDLTEAASSLSPEEYSMIPSPATGEPGHHGSY